jgi:type IV secretory pathway TraG/TraD family ATPase VirD4
MTSNLPVSVASPNPSLPVATRDTGLALGTAAWRDLVAEGIAKVPDSCAWTPGEIWLSRDPRSGWGFGSGDDRHILIASGTRSGKGASIIIPNLCLWPGSAVVIDPKGENAMVTARRRTNGSRFCRGMGQKVRILDPFNEVKTSLDDFADLKVSFNPMDMLDPAREESIDEAARIADMIVVSENSADPFWEDSGKAIIKTLQLHVASWPDYLPRERNLLTVRRLLMAGDAETRKLMKLNSDDGDIPSGLALLFQAMQRNPAFNGIVSNAGVMFEGMLRDAPRTLMSILQVACTNTDFMESPPMQRSLARSDFSLSELKSEQQGATLYVCLPQRFMETHFRWLRLMTSLTLTEMERHAHKPACGHPVLMVLDEFPALRRMRLVENAAAQIAGFGVRMMFVVQTLAQLKDIYRDNWETLVANSGVKLFFGNDDHFTREYVSKLCGDCEVIRTTHSMSITDGLSEGHSHSSTFGSSSTYGTSVSSNATIGVNGSSSSGFSSSVSHTSSQSDTYGTNQSKSRSNTKGSAETIHKRPLLTPDEVGRYFGDRDHPAALVLVSGHQPLNLKRTNYFEDERFEDLFDSHRDHPLPPTLEESAQQRLEALKRRKAEALLEEEAARKRAEEEEAEETRKRLKAAEFEARYMERLAAKNRRQIMAAVSVAAVVFLLLGFWAAPKGCPEGFGSNISANRSGVASTLCMDAVCLLGLRTLLGSLSPICETTPPRPVRGGGNW